MTKYYPYGECRNSQGDLGTDRKFTGQRLDGTGLYYYGARYYDPAIGRFISADIVIQNPANPQSFNRYSYCLNNPLKYVDPTGLIVVIENEAIVIEALEYGIYGSPGSPLEEMMLEWAENWTEWEELKEEEPVYTQYMIDSEITFNIVDINASSKTISFNLGTMPLISFNEPVQLCFVNRFEMSAITWNSPEANFPLWWITGISLYPDPIYIRTGQKFESTKAFTRLIAHELYHRWEQSEFALHPNVLGSWYRMYRLEIYRHPLSHNNWPSEKRAINYANAYFPK